MKLATYNDGSRDGQLVVVSRDLATAHYATGIAGRLQQVVDDWNFLAPQLEELSQTLNHGKARHAFEFDPRQCSAPLPRPGIWAEADPRAQQARLQLGRADAMLGPRATLQLPDEPPAGVSGFELRARIALLTGDIAARTDAASALDGIRLLLLTCSVHALQQADEAGGALAIACAPVALTPDELGSAWGGGVAELVLQLRRAGRHAAGGAGGAEVPPTNVAPGELLQLASRWTGLRAGSLVGCGCSSAVLQLPWPEPGERLHVEAATIEGLQPFGTIELGCGRPD